MDKDYLIKTLEIDCPICNKVHPVEERKRMTQAVVKDEIIDYEQVYFCCPLIDEDDNEFVPASVMDENLLRARNAYRIKNGLLTSKDIAQIRSYYGLSQSDFAALLGWGDVTVTRYESKTIQDETYDNIIRMVYNSPLFALECLNKHKDRFSCEKLTKIRMAIKGRVVERGNFYLKKQEIESLYVCFEEEADYNGYKLLDLEKVSNVIGYFAQFVDNLYKVKLMKLLWYADAIYFGRHSHSITGLVYKHMPLGALPVAFYEIIYVPTVSVVEELINEDIAYRIYPNKVVTIANFSLDELNVLEMVAKKFMVFKTKEIVDYMHKEKAYMETMHNQIIPYSLAKQLNELK